MKMSRKNGLWKRNWKQRAGALALAGGLLITGTSVVYGAQENPVSAALSAETRQTGSIENEKLLRLEEYLKQCWAKKQEVIDMREYKITYEQLNEVIYSIHYEEPEYYWAIHLSSHEDDPATGLMNTYYQYYKSDTGRPFERMEELEREWDMMEERIKDCKTDLEKALVVHDHLVESIKYSASLGTRAHDVEGGILEKAAVCEGYALAYKFYMNRMGIPCKVVSGQSKKQSHAWNQIQIDGKWYFVDATWDDTTCALAAGNHPVKHQYFLTSEAEFTDHIWEKENYETCDDTTYDDAEWRWNARRMTGYQGGLYVAGSFPRDNVMKSGIWRFDAEDPEKQGELVLPIEDEWQVTSNRKGPGCMELSYYDGNLYYNTPKAIWKWNFDPNTSPEKVLELAEDVRGEIWYLNVADGKVYYETAIYSNGVKDKREYVIDADYQKAKQPIAVTDSVMTVKMNEKETILQSCAPGYVTYTSNNPDICEAEPLYKDESCRLIPKKAGETTVTVRAASTDHYQEASVDVKIIVTDDSVSEQKITLQYEAGENGSLNAVNAASGESLSNGAQIEPNTEVRFTAVPDQGYSVKNWIVNGAVYTENGQVYTNPTLQKKIKASSDSVRVEFVKDAPAFVKGDVNLDGKVEIGDVREALRSICKKTELTEAQKQAGDINGNGTVDIEDMRTIFRVVCGKIESL